MLVVNRFRVPDAEADDFPGRLTAVLDVLRARPGFVEGEVGRSVDEPDLWVLCTRWVGVGAYRRAIGSYEAKLHAVPLLSRAVDEPSAYEVLEPDADPATALNTASTRSIP